MTSITRTAPQDRTTTDRTSQDRPQQEQAPATSSPPLSLEEAVSMYAAKRGDTLSSIARRHNTSVDRLREMNPGLNERRIRIGQDIRVPGTPTRAPVDADAQT